MLKSKFLILLVIGIFIIMISVSYLTCVSSSKIPDSSTTQPATSAQTEIKGMTFIGTNPQNYKEYRHEATGMVFVLIPGGRFKMGSDEYDDEKPIHDVIISNFLMAKYETTQSVWEKIMGNNPSQFKGDNNPVHCVSWEDCLDFAKKTGLRLPTEAEWEYACRAGTTTKYYWGDYENENYMWYNDAQEGSSHHPVGQKKPNGFGLYDMMGNVWEWCEDWYDETYYQNSPKENPKGPDGPDDEQSCALRGGAWFQEAVYQRSTNRGWQLPSQMCGSLGVRFAHDFK
ncbi:MAG: formylglycine-generating enzyme family protein [Planctomycetota bacterium]